MSYVIGTLSKQPALVIRLCESFRRGGETVPIVIADDGLPEDLDLARFEPIERIKCPKPFVFSRNVNEIARHAATEDVFIANDDAFLVRGGVGFLEETSKRSDAGVVSAGVIGACGEHQQALEGSGVFEFLDHKIAFVAVYLSRTLLSKIGLMDERFTGYGYDDYDYSLRAIKAGLKNIVDHRCVVNHVQNNSTYKLDPELNRLQEHGANEFVTKWGFR